MDDQDKTDLAYAIRQLSGIHYDIGWAATADRVQRAKDALERIHERAEAVPDLVVHGGEAGGA